MKPNDNEALSFIPSKTIGRYMLDSEFQIPGLELPEILALDSTSPPPHVAQTRETGARSFDSKHDGTSIPIGAEKLEFP
jgi:hypothetical protein